MVFRNHRTLAMMVMLAFPAVCVTMSFGEDAAPGVVRISDHPPGQPAIQQIIIPTQHQIYRAAPPDAVIQVADPTASGQVLPASWGSSFGFGGHDDDQWSAACPSCGKRSMWKRMFGGGNSDFGADKPWKPRRQAFGFGAYDITYAVNPYYQDPRDSRVYSAQGWGVPMGVPLAPVVNHSYNYGWGIPSSRMTPVSRPLR